MPLPSYRLMAPGPVPLPEKVLKALAEPMIHHRTPEFDAILSRVLAGLKNVFQTRQPVLMHAATGSGAMESAIVNTLSPGDEALFIVSGKFGERWASQGKAYGLTVHVLNVEWGRAVRLEDVERALKAQPGVKAVFTQVCETSTATLHPIRELAQLVGSRPECLFVVDAITALGATAFAMDDWQIDVAVAGSQKAFMIPTGLSFIALSEKAWRFYEKARCPRFYFDLKPELEANKNGETRFSSAVNLIRGLDVALEDLTGENLCRQILRCERLAAATRAAGEALGLEIFSKSPSPSVTALVVPAGFDGAKLRLWLEEKHRVTVMGGQDQLKGRILRIGHLGYITDEDMSVTIAALADSLNQLSPGFVTPEGRERALKLTRDLLSGGNP